MVPLHSDGEAPRTVCPVSESVSAGPAASLGWLAECQEFACRFCFRNRLRPLPHGFTMTYMIVVMTYMIYMIMTYMAYMIMTYMTRNDAESMHCWKWWGNTVNPDSISGNRGSFFVTAAL